MTVHVERVGGIRMNECSIDWKGLKERCVGGKVISKEKIENVGREGVNWFERGFVGLYLRIGELIFGNRLKGYSMHESHNADCCFRCLYLILKMQKTRTSFLSSCLNYIIIFI